MGRRSVPRTTDLEIEAWAPTCERCIEQAVDALVDCFILQPRPEPSETVEWSHPGHHPENLLADLLDGVLYHVATLREIPVAISISRDGEWHIRFETAALAAADPRGTAPEFASLHSLRLRPDRGGWHCTAVLDTGPESTGRMGSRPPEDTRIQHSIPATGGPAGPPSGAADAPPGTPARPGAAAPPP